MPPEESTRPLRALIAEDEPADAELMLGALRRAGFEPSAIRVDAEPAFRQALSPDLDVILADYAIPGFGAVRALEVARSAGLDVPLIVVSGAIGEEAAAAIVRQGAADYLPKDRLGRLGTAVAAAMERRRLGAEACEAYGRLQESAAQYRSLFRESPVPMWLCDDETLEFLEVNDAAVALYGYTPDEFRAMSLLQIRPAEDVPRFLAHREQRRGGARLRGSFRHCRKDGSLIDVDVHSSPFSFRGRRATLVVVNDTTAMRRAEAARERLLQVIEATTDAIVIAGPDGRLQYANPAFRRLLRWPEHEELSSFTIADASAGASRRQLEEVVLPALRRDGLWQGERVWRRRDGADVTVSIVAVAPKGSDGVLAYMAAVARDLTEQKLLQAQLHQAQKMEAIGRLAGGVAHDFNNMLAVITAYTSLLLQDAAEGDPIRADLQEIQHAAERASALTRQLLTFSRRQVIEPHPLDLNLEIAEMGRMLRRVLGEDIELAVVPAADLGTVLLDPGQLEQVVMNLAVNARDAMPQGGRLTLETANVDLDEDYCRTHVDARPGRHVLLAVSDDGHGMDAATRAQIFEPFFTTKERSKGTGLGLSTVYGIVKQSGGHVSVYSEPGVGSTFRIYFPRVEAPPEPRAARGDEPTPGGRETILVVEDEEGVLKAAAQILARRGYRVIGARNAGEALLSAEREATTIHLLLTDVVLPQVSGPDLAERLQRIRPGLKVLFMSGYTEAAMSRNGVLAPGTRLLEKPFKPEDLLRRVREALDA